jgi:flagellar biosynthesis protein
LTETKKNIDASVASNRTMAIALHYPGRGATRVIGKGGGLVGEYITTTARAHGIPLDEDPALTNALARVEFGREIPPELYIAVAQVLAFAWKVGKK